MTSTLFSYAGYLSWILITFMLLNSSEFPYFHENSWDIGCLRDLLNDVDTIVRTDQNTLPHLKEKFARVYVNFDITKPLPGCLTITKEDLSMRVAII